MDIEERIAAARKVLGEGVRVVRRRRGGKKGKNRPVSTFVPRKKSSRRDMSRSEYEQCGKKIRYATESDARKYAARLSETRGYPIRAYECPYCNGFHLTHKPNKSVPVRYNFKRKTQLH